MVKKKSKKQKKFSSKKIISGREDKQLLWFFVIIGAVFGLFIGTYFYIQGLDHFDYAGVTWNKIKEGQIEIYYSKFKLGDRLPTYNAYLRNDPRKNKIPINASFKFPENVIISFEDSKPECQGKDSYLAALIGPYFTAMGINATGAITNKERAVQQNMTFADCSSVNSNTVVIIVQSSDKPSIVQSSENSGCYYFNIGNCQHIETGERFIIGILGQTSGEKI